MECGVHFEIEGSPKLNIVWYICRNDCFFLSAFHACPVEPVARIIQRRSGTNSRVSSIGSASGQVSCRAIQRQPKRRPAAGGRRSQTGRKSTCTVFLQGSGAGRQHDTVSTTSLKIHNQLKMINSWSFEMCGPLLVRKPDYLPDL